MGKSSNKNQKNCAPPQKQSDNKVPQLDRVREAETALNNLLTTIDPDHEKTPKTNAGGMEGRLSHIVKMTTKLTKIVHKTGNTPEKQLPSQVQDTSQD